MEIPLDKAIPRAIAAAVVVYCLWPSITALLSKPESKPPAKLPEISAALLSPSLPSPPERDPFGANSAALASSLKPTSKPPANAADKSGPSKRGGTADSKVTTARLSATGSHAGAKTADKAGSRGGGLTLEATCIVGNQRLAVINGRLYAPKETLSLPGLSATPYEVVNVQPYKVVLKCGKDDLELTYPDYASETASAEKKANGKKSKTASKRSKPKQSNSAKGGAKKKK